jgi:hypothetical protein
MNLRRVRKANIKKSEMFSLIYFATYCHLFGKRKITFLEYLSTRDFSLFFQILGEVPSIRCTQKVGYCTICGLLDWFNTEKGYERPVVSFSVGLGVYVLEPLSTYRGRGEIGGVYLPSQLERTLQLCT